MAKHEWRERLEDGDLRFWRAVQDRGTWRLTFRLKAEEHWTRREPLTLEDVLRLREVLWNKYQRRRVPWERIRELDEQIEELGGDPQPGSATGP